MEKIDILSLSLEELETEVLRLGEKKYRAKQIFEWLHVKKTEKFEEMTSINKEFCAKLNREFCIKRLIVVRKLESCMDNTVKYLYELDDGNHIESVLMEYNYGYSLCISTQVGCRMGCKFCASTLGGLVRNLEPSEILLQVYSAQKEMDKLGRGRLSGIVLMGIGEPLDNFENVKKFLSLVSCKDGINMSLRHVALSTCGLAEKIDALAELKLGLTLSVSLHSANDKKRNEIMPVNKAYNIDRLMKSCRNYIDKTGRRITFEYAVIDGENSSEADARELAALLKGMNCHINLIPINYVKERGYTSKAKTVNEFQKKLEGLNMNTTIRRTLGYDINAACGQLRHESETNNSINEEK